MSPDHFVNVERKPALPRLAGADPPPDVSGYHPKDRAMDVVRFADAPLYTAPDHEEIEARRLQGGEASTAGFRQWSAIRRSPPVRSYRWVRGRFGKVYVVTEGALTIEQADGLRYVLASW